MLKKEHLLYRISSPNIKPKLIDPASPFLLDLASAPGGFDHDWARAHGYHVIWALSLPGKTAPVTAGRIIGETIRQMLNEEGGGV